MRNLIIKHQQIKKKIFLVFFLNMFFLLSFGQKEKTTIKTFPAPAGAMTFGTYHVTVNDKQIPTHRAIQNDFRKNDKDWDLNYGDYGFVTFDFEGKVQLRINSRLAIDKAIVQPFSDSIKVEFPKPNVAIIEIDKPGQYSFEPFGPISPLIIFANSPEVDIPSKNDDGVIYFGPGLHRPEGGIILLSDNQTLYLHGEAIVEAGLRIKGKNINIKGRGILDGSPWLWREGPISKTRDVKDENGRIIDRGHFNTLRDSRNVRIEGITVRGSPHWTFYIQNCEDVVFENIKIVGGKNLNDDGIDPVNSRKVTVRNSFIRTTDDCFALKGHYNQDGPVEDVLVENCVLWTEAQRIVLLGAESHAPAMRNLTFRDIDVIHMGPNACLALRPGEEMMLENILFENIRINADGYVGVINPMNVILLNPTSSLSGDNKKSKPGHIRDIIFRDIVVTGTEKRKNRISITGFDEEHQVSNVQFINVNMFGEKANPNSDFVKIGKFVNNIYFK